MAQGDITSPSGLFLLFFAAFFDAAAFIVFIIEVWFDLGIIATIVAYTGWIVVPLLAWLLGYLSFKDLVKSTAEKAQEGTAKKGGSQKISGSSDMKDWKQNKDGVYELQNNKPIEAGGSGDIKDWEQNKDGAYQLKDKASPESPQPSEAATPLESPEPAEVKTPGQKSSPGPAKKAAHAIWGFIKMMGWNYLIEMVPWVQDVWPGLTFFVWRIVKNA